MAQYKSDMYFDRYITAFTNKHILTKILMGAWSIEDIVNLDSHSVLFLYHLCGIVDVFMIRLTKFTAF